MKIIAVKVITKARKEEVVGYRGEELVVKVTTVPEKGKANERVIALLAKWLDVAPSHVTLLQGMTSSHKKFRIEAP